MFEPHKLITVALGVVLLAPFAFIFWRIAAHEARPEAEVRAELLSELQQRNRQVGKPSPDGEFTASSSTLRRIEAIGLSENTMSWLVFYPHQWAGILGLFGIACVLGGLIVSLFFPGGIEVSTEDLESPSATETRK